MVVSLQNQFGIHNSTSGLNTVEPRYTLSVNFSKALSSTAADCSW